MQQGKVRYIGCSNWQAWKIAKALGISELKNLARFDTLQAYYSIAGRDLEREIVPLLESERVGLLVWSPLAGGFLSGKFSRTNQKPADSRRTELDFPIVDKERTWKILDVMAPIAKAHECSPARVSLAWLLAKPVVTSVIIGAKRHDQLQDNLAAVELTLTRDELRQLDEVSALPPVKYHPKFPPFYHLKLPPPLPLLGFELSFWDPGSTSWRGLLRARSGRQAARFFRRLRRRAVSVLVAEHNRFGHRLRSPSCGLRFFDRLRLRWRQLVEILAGDVRLPALVNAGAFVEVALSVADFDFEPGSGAPRPVL